MLNAEPIVVKANVGCGKPLPLELGFVLVCAEAFEDLVGVERQGSLGPRGTIAPPASFYSRRSRQALR